MVYDQKVHSPKYSQITREYRTEQRKKWHFGRVFQVVNSTTFKPASMNDIAQSTFPHFMHIFANQFLLTKPHFCLIFPIFAKLSYSYNTFALKP